MSEPAGERMSDWLLRANVFDRRKPAGEQRSLLPQTIDLDLVKVIVASPNARLMYDGAPAYVSGPWIDIVQKTITYTIEVVPE